MHSLAIKINHPYKPDETHITGSSFEMTLQRIQLTLGIPCMWLNKHTYGCNVPWRGILSHDIDIPGKVCGETTYPYPKPNACIVEVWEWIRDFFLHFIMSVTTYSHTVLWSFPRRALKQKYHRDDFAITVIPWLILTCMYLFSSAFYISVKYFMSVWKKTVLALVTMTS